MGKSEYPLDAILLNGMSHDVRKDFEAFMAELDAEHERLGKPYGDGSLWHITGAECWHSFYCDGYTAKDALQEDLNND